MYAMRLWSVRNSAALEKLYIRFEGVFVKLGPLLDRIGYERAEKPVTIVERAVKGFLFDCQMCGKCVLSSTGMACPMNCPKQLRNGPCGGVRNDGNCEVIADMRCVWVEAIEGASHMQGGAAIQQVQLPINHKLQGRSSWLRVIREKNATNPDVDQSVVAGS
jgi:hypothetical protein